jgi:hypothetical protein
VDQLQNIHRNDQTISILTSSINKEEFNWVDDLDVVKDVWNTLRMAHEGSRPIRKAKVKVLEGQLNYFIMYDDETPHEMFNRLKKLVNKARALGSKKWTDRMLMKRLMMTYTPMNINVMTLIRQDPAYKKICLEGSWIMKWIFKRPTILRISKGCLNLQEIRYCSQSKQKQEEESFDWDP